jgi:hypothetical protein
VVVAAGMGKLYLGSRLHSTAETTIQLLDTNQFQVGDLSFHLDTHGFIFDRSGFSRAFNTYLLQRNATYKRPT